MPNQREVRFDAVGKLTLLADDSGWVMVRRPRAMPFVMSRVGWDSLPHDPARPSTLLDVDRHA